MKRLLSLALGLALLGGVLLFDSFVPAGVSAAGTGPQNSAQNSNSSTGNTVPRKKRRHHKRKRLIIGGAGGAGSLARHSKVRKRKGAIIGAGVGAGAGAVYTYRHRRRKH